MVRADQASRLLDTVDNQMFTVVNVAVLVYFVGFLVRFGVLLMGLWQLYLVYRHGEKQQQLGYKLVFTSLEHLPFSFGRWLFWNKDSWDASPEAEKQVIVRHEVTHIRQHHTFDIMLAEAIWVLCWFSPFPWLFRNSLRTVHEYLADESATEAASNRREYGLVLLRQAPSGRVFEVSNTFIRSQLKKRINMLVKHRSSRLSYLKYIAVFPMVMLITVSFQVSILAQVSMDKFEKTEYGEAYKIKKTYGNNTWDDFHYFKYSLPATADLVSVDTVITFNPETYEETVVIVQNTCFIKADKMPQFKGGEAAMYAWLAKNLVYPQDAKDAKVTGTVIIEFAVGQNGYISEVRVVGRAHPLLDKAAFALICEMPDWEPGENKGQKTSVLMSLPIKFE